MKYFIFIISLFFLTSSIFAAANKEDCNFDTTTNAVDFLQGCAEGTPAIDPSLETNDEEWIKDRVKNIAKWAISLGALLAVGALVWAGIQYTKAYGEDESLKKAKTTGVYALIGLLLLMASFGLVNIFVNFVYSLAGP